MRRFAAPLAVLSLTAALAACTDEPEPRFTDPTPEPSETATEPTTEPTSGPTTEPTSEPEALGPEETVRAWVEAYNALTRDGDSGGLDPLTSPDCVGCSGFTDPIVSLYESGGRMETDGITIASVRRAVDFKRSRVVSSALNIAAGVTYPGQAKEVAFKATKSIANFRLRRENGTWLVTRLEFLS
jgi:hypothetical protein